MIVRVNIVDRKSRDSVLDFVIRKKDINLHTIKSLLENTAMESKKLDSTKKTWVSRTIRSLEKIMKNNKEKKLQTIIPTRGNQLYLIWDDVLIILESFIVINLDENNKPKGTIK